MASKMIALNLMPSVVYNIQFSQDSLPVVAETNHFYDKPKFLLEHQVYWTLATEWNLHVGHLYSAL